MADAGTALDFHRLLLTMTCNDFLWQIERVIAIGLAERDRIVHTATPARRPGPESPRALDAITAKIPGAAEAAMHGLVNKSGEDLDRTKKQHSRALQRNFSAD